MRYSSIFLYRSRLYSALEIFLNSVDIIKAYIPTLSYTITPESYTDFFIAKSSVSTESYYLQPSPELYLKKLIAREKQSFYYIGPVYRANEPLQSPLHMPEFDMLEFYKIGYSYDMFIQLCQELFLRVYTEFPYNYCVNQRNFRKESVVIEWKELFAQAHIDFNDIRTAIAQKEQNILRPYLGISDDFETCFYKIFYTELEHTILDGRLWFLSLYPQEMGALANIRDGGIAERFEIFWNGIEIMNSYGESSNSEFMRDIMEHENKVRLQTGKPTVTLDEGFLHSVGNLPRMLSGGSIGLDRVLYIISGNLLDARNIQDLSVFNLR